MTMKNWIIKKLGGYTKSEYMEERNKSWHSVFSRDIQEAVRFDKHMQFISMVKNFDKQVKWQWEWLNNNFKDYMDIIKKDL